MVTRHLALHEYYTVTVMRSRSNEYGEIRVRCLWHNCTLCIMCSVNQGLRRKHEERPGLDPGLSVTLVSCYEALSLLSKRSIRLWRFLLASRKP